MLFPCTDRMRRFGKTVIIALGGSIVVPDTINTDYLKQFVRFIHRWKRTHRFIVVIGGGEVARRYQRGAAKVARVTDEDKDWIGIHATRLNAHLLRTVFREIADPVVFDSRFKMKTVKYPITIASGWRPGWSTDYVAAQISADFSAGAFIVAGKPSHVYTNDPVIHMDAIPMDALSWKQYRKMIPKRWIPGSHFPVDPVAARLADKERLTAYVVDWREIKNLEALITGKKYRGTELVSLIRASRARGGG